MSECTIIDGDGGLLSPIAPNTLTIDLIRRLSPPVLIVTTPTENAINNALMTIYTAMEKNINIRGIIINNIDTDCPKSLLSSIPRVIEEYTNVKIIGLLPRLNQKYLPEDLITAILNGIDIESVFNVKIAKLDMN